MAVIASVETGTGAHGRPCGQPPSCSRASRSALLIDLIDLSLNHGLFVVKAARYLADAEAILEGWPPHIGVVDMDHDGSAGLLEYLDGAQAVTGSVMPVLGLTRRGDLRTRLRAFDLGVDDILTVPFSPEELLARCMVLARRAPGTDRPIVPTIRSARSRSTSSTVRSALEPLSFT